MTAFASLPLARTAEDASVAVVQSVPLRSTSIRDLARRTMHGGTGWMSSLARSTGYQPQDQDDAAKQDAIRPVGRRAPIGEPEDAGITGGTRSLMRRLSGLNVAVREVKLHNVAVARH